MIKIKNSFILAGIALLLSGCYEVDFFSVELREDLSSTVQFIVVAPEGANDPEYFKSAQEQLESCGFGIKENINSSDSLAFSGRQDFQTKTDLELAMRCNPITNSLIKVYPPIVEEDIFGTTFQLQLEIRSNDEWQAPFREIRITLPGKIKAFRENSPANIRVNSSISGSGTAIFDFSASKLEEHEYGFEYWELPESFYIKASSYKSKIEIQWFITTVLGLLTFILGSGAIKYFSKKQNDQGSQK